MSKVSKANRARKTKTKVDEKKDAKAKRCQLSIRDFFTKKSDNTRTEESDFKTGTSTSHDFQHLEKKCDQAHSQESNSEPFTSHCNAISQADVSAKANVSGKGPMKRNHAQAKSKGTSLQNVDLLSESPPCKMIKTSSLQASPSVTPLAQDSTKFSECVDLTSPHNLAPTSHVTEEKGEGLPICQSTDESEELCRAVPEENGVANSSLLNVSRDLFASFHESASTTPVCCSKQEQEELSEQQQQSSLLLQQQQQQLSEQQLPQLQHQNQEQLPLLQLPDSNQDQNMESLEARSDMSSSSVKGPAIPVSDLSADSLPTVSSCNTPSNAGTPNRVKDSTGKSSCTPKKWKESARKASTFLFASPHRPESPPSSVSSLSNVTGGRHEASNVAQLSQPEANSVMSSPTSSSLSLVKRQLWNSPVNSSEATLQDGARGDGKTVENLLEDECTNFDELFASLDSNDSLFATDCIDSSCTESKSPSPPLPHYNLFTVSSVTDDLEQRTKTLLLLESKGSEIGTSRSCVLKDDWFYIGVAAGDTIRLVDPVIDVYGNFTVDGQHESYLVLNPDWLIGATTVAAAVMCPRKAVLSEVFKGNLVRSEGGGQEAMILGSLLHSVFEKVLIASREKNTSGGSCVTSDFVRSVMRETVTSLSTLESLYAVGMTESDALKRLDEYCPAIVDWVDKFLHSKPLPGRGNIEFHWPRRDRSSSEVGGASRLCVSEVVDIEENVWTPRFGLKGKVDSTVEVKIHSRPGTGSGEGGGGSATSSTREVRYGHVPFELKTGKMWSQLGSAEHRAQVILYTVMLGERHRTEVAGGLLHYLKAQHMLGVPAFPREKRALLILRNQVAGCLSNNFGKTAIPEEMLGQERICRRCSHLSQCCLYHKAVERGTAATSLIPESFQSVVGHLKEDDLIFFVKWFSLIDRELQFSRRRKPLSDLWIQDIRDRVESGVCAANMRPTEHTTCPDGRIRQVLAVSDGQVAVPVETMSVGERVVVSGMDGHSWAVAIGNVRHVCESSITILIDRVLQDKSLYRVDVCSSPSGNHMWVAVAALMLPAERETKLRDLIVRLREPRFDLVNLESDLSGLQVELAHLNLDQLKAIKMCLVAKDYLLIQGMPGTGKTTTLAALIRVLVAKGNTVLYTSFTNNAVDNLLLKLKGVEFIRVSSNSASVHPAIQDRSTSVRGRRCSTVKELACLYEKTPVVGVTCMGMHHPLFSRRHFDYCIIDEATQVTTPTVLGPLLMADKFVLVGDHYQLPPLVQDKEAKEAGLGTSLFKMLCDTHPKSLVSLAQQFRMNRDIMLLSNVLTYDSKLVAGSPEVAMATLNLPHWSVAMETEEDVDSGCSHDWIHTVVDPNRSVWFIDTDKMDARECYLTSGDRWNVTESVLVSKIVQKLLLCGLKASDIGIITPYRQQQKVISEALKAQSVSFACRDSNPSDQSDGCKGIEVNTVDKYQGRDKNCIIVSFVRSNPECQVGKLLEDTSRINVALTRAKRKLLLVGSRSTLSASPFFSKLVALLETRGWIKSAG